MDKSVKMAALQRWAQVGPIKLDCICNWLESRYGKIKLYSDMSGQLIARHVTTHSLLLYIQTKIANDNMADLEFSLMDTMCTPTPRTPILFFLMRKSSPNQSNSKARNVNLQIRNHKVKTAAAKNIISLHSLLFFYSL